MSMKSTEQTTKTFILYRDHIDVVTAKRQRMGNASESAAMRAIIDEWQELNAEQPRPTETVQETETK